MNNAYYLKLSTKGIEHHKVFSTRKGVVAYIHEYMKKEYKSYDSKFVGRYQKWSNKLAKTVHSEYSTELLETKINIRHMEYERAYGSDKEIYKTMQKMK